MPVPESPSDENPDDVKSHKYWKYTEASIFYQYCLPCYLSYQKTNISRKRHFGRSISDAGVHILDPATGTGTFPVYILREIGPEKIRQKFSNEVHANEISILPYYIAALNIEHTYKEIVGEYREFENICWMDTLDIGYKDPQKLSAWFEEDDNVKRISNQRDAPIFVVIGNPPYNAAQTNFNDANSTKKYSHIDKMIYADYSKKSSTKNVNASLDMYKRFLKWSSKRINKKGMVVFVTNNSFLNAKGDDGFRKAVYEEFDHIYTVNLKGNSRIAGKRAKREAGNVFDIRVGVAISFFVKTGKDSLSLQYAEIADYLKTEEKLKWLKENTLSTLNFETIIPTENAIWLNQTDNDFDDLLPVLSQNSIESIFEEVTMGVNTNKDDWAYDFDKHHLRNKMKYYISTYNEIVKKYNQDSKIGDTAEWVDKKIKWSGATLQYLEKKYSFSYSDEKIKLASYRPFVRKYQYHDQGITERPRKFSDVFKNSHTNWLISFSNPVPNSIFDTIGTNLITDNHFLPGGTQNIPLWRYDDEGKRHNNITKYALGQFQKHYKNQMITGEDIFYYVYAIFNDPKYKETYQHNLQQGLPRIPLAKDFEKFKSIGKNLFELHSQFNDVEEYNLVRTEKIVKKNQIKLLLKDDEEKKEHYKIMIDEKTTLKNIPPEIVKYEIISRNPLEWVLTAYKENKNLISDSSSDDESVRTKFSNYNFEDHKEDVISLLKKVTTVCVETVKLRNQLRDMEWGPQPKFEFTRLEKSKNKPEKKSTKSPNPKKPTRPKKTRSKKLDGF